MFIEMIYDYVFSIEILLKKNLEHFSVRITQ